MDTMGAMMFNTKQEKGSGSFLVILTLCISSFLFLHNLPLWIFEQVYWWAKSSPPGSMLVVMSPFVFFAFFLLVFCLPILTDIY